MENCSQATVVPEHAESDDGSHLRVTPQPAYGQWQVRFPHSGEWTLAAYDVAGRSAGNWKSTSNSLVIDLGDQAPGLYLLRAGTATGDALSTKLVMP